MLPPGLLAGGAWRTPARGPGSTGRTEGRSKCFIDTFTEKVARPIISAKLAQKDELLKVMELAYETIDNAALTSDDESVDEMLEAMMSRIRGVIAIVSRMHGSHGSQKSDVEFLRQEGEAGQSSLYNALVNNQNYQPLVSEYWQTIEHCKVEIPKNLKD